ncbi:MAG TPA: tRNA 4-thiouridine(8) synthase ThiI [Eubacteriaceae bacterium]|nr:tRNA 4-thiouridine(8) synthase ThiI [Eubacteriaceae bacterium]
MKKVIIVRYGEIALKGKNRSFFMDKLASNIKKRISFLSSAKLRKIQGRFIVETDDSEVDEALQAMQDVFGIASLSLAMEVASSIEEIEQAAIEIMKEEIDSKKEVSFKVSARRGNKAFPYTSPQINGQLGGLLLKTFEELHVDVHQPEIELFADVRDQTYLYTKSFSGKGGLPIGCSGKAALLLSGGIDSPVAGYMIANRGVELIGVHFHSHPYTSDRSKEKVIQLTKQLSKYSGKIKLFIVPFTDIQLEILDKCEDKLGTIIMRRFMMKIAERIARHHQAKALITGESIGQVASQTLESLMATDAAVDLPVFRPLIGMDKHEIIRRAEQIDTYETSILPYEDCCTVFVPKHPQTKPDLNIVTRQEEKIEDSERLLLEAVQNSEIMTI